jgi:hypothetical protein
MSDEARTAIGDPRTNGQGEWSDEDKELIAEELQRLRRVREAKRLLAEEDAGDDDGWTPVDVGPYVRGEITMPEPSVGLARNDGVKFIYPAREHAVVADTGAGKSWLSAAMAVAEMRKGNRVVYIHYEEPEPTLTVEWLMLLGASRGGPGPVRLRRSEGGGAQGAAGEAAGPGALAGAPRRGQSGDGATGR